MCCILATDPRNSVNTVRSFDPGLGEIGGTEQSRARHFRGLDSQRHSLRALVLFKSLQHACHPPMAVVPQSGDSRDDDPLCDNSPVPRATWPQQRPSALTSQHTDQVVRIPAPAGSTKTCGTKKGNPLPGSGGLLNNGLPSIQRPRRGDGEPPSSKRSNDAEAY